MRCSISSTYVGKSPLVAFRAEFDRVMLERAMRDVLGVPLGLPLDRPRVPAAGAVSGHECCDSLDEWLAHFGGDIAVRHHALADAYATAQLLQIALAAADAAGMESRRAAARDAEGATLARHPSLTGRSARIAFGGAVRA